jgi:hypothetical protein
MSTNPISRLPRLAQTYLVVAAADLVGAVVAATSGLVGAERAIVSGSAINAPLPFLAGQLAVLAVATRLRRHAVGTAAAAVLCAAGVVSVVSGFGDGSYAAALDAGERAIQLVLVAATAVTVPLAAAQVVAAARRRLRPAAA